MGLRGDAALAYFILLCFDWLAFDVCERGASEAFE